MDGNVSQDKFDYERLFLSMPQNIQIISAPSILGLKPTGVEHLGERLLACGLLESETRNRPVINVNPKNNEYNFNRDEETKCLNPHQIKDFSLDLIKTILGELKAGTFPIVLGGDCSILLGIMPALKKMGTFGLIFLDAHADFYEPSKSVTGEVADMDLAIVTGRGPDILTNIGGLKPYVEDENVIHVGQRDAEETKKYGSQDIRNTAINSFDLESFRVKGASNIIGQITALSQTKLVDGFWIHFDTDVLCDEENPAVDYRLPGGLAIKDVQQLLAGLLETGKMLGMSVTIFNPALDTDGRIAEKIVSCLNRVLSSNERNTVH